MISKNLIKYVHSLGQKKGRTKENAFVAEGYKVVEDLLEVMNPLRLIATEAWFAARRRQPTEADVVVSEEELRRISFVQHPQQVMGIFPIPAPDAASVDAESQLVVALDDIQDPGNLGTIIRIADWFGIRHILCSRETADVWNPKVVQATMGSIARVHIIYCDLAEYLRNLPAGTPVYGTFLDGSNLYEASLEPRGVIVMGNEGNGVSAEVAALANQRLLIPSFPAGKKTADSLNVAIATAITCAEFRRRMG